MTSTSSAPALSTTELSLRWVGLPCEGALRNWRVAKKGPRFEVRAEGGIRRVVYPLAAVQQYELERSSIKRGVAWRGRFLSLDQLVLRWAGTALEVPDWKLALWRKARGKGQGPPYVLVHVRQPLFPLEALEAWERTRLHELGVRIPPSASP